MPKATRGKAENETPKKRTRKANPVEGNGTNAPEPVTTAPSIADTTSKVVAKEIAASPLDQGVVGENAPKKTTRKTKPAEGNGTEAVTPAHAIAETTSQAARVIAQPPVPQKVVVTEELVRRRAYEIYLRRRGQGGSPEQDWFQALQEIYGQHVA